VRLLQRADVGLEETVHQRRRLHGPELALVLEWLRLGPEPEDDVEGFARHLAIDAGRAIDVEHLPIARQSARGHAEVQAAARDVVEHCDAIGELGRVVIGQQEPAWADADVLRLHQGLRDEQIGCGMWFPRCRVVLTDPALGIAELIEPAEHL
jgi:hypothetical protein